MTMAQGAVAVEIAVPMRMMGAIGGLAARSRAAGDAGDEQTRIGQTQCQQGDAGKQRRGSEVSWVRHMRRRRSFEMLRDGAGELADPGRCAVRMLVHGLVRVLR